MKKNKSCYLCKKNPISTAFNKLGWDILYCENCKLYCLDFKDSYQDMMKKYYDKRYYTGSKQRAGYCNYLEDETAERKNMKNYLKGILSYHDSGKLLDIGCATGIFLHEAEDAGFSVYGVDISDYAANIAKKRFGTRIKISSIEKANFKQKFSVITMFDVLEHLDDPRKVLLKLKKLLSEDGLLVINTGDTDSLLARLQGKNWHFFIPPQHFFYFSLFNLKKLLNQAGYKVISVDRKGKWLTLRYLFHLARQIQNDAISHLLFAFVGNNYLGKIPVYLNLFDNITVYAKRKEQK